MNAKEKFIFIMLGALFIGAFYYYAMTEDLNRRMDELNLADKNHVDKVLGAYSDSLHTYNLRFIGRGKHIRKAQKDIVANTELIEKNTDSLDCSPTSSSHGPITCFAGASGDEWLCSQ